MKEKPPVLTWSNLIVRSGDVPSSPASIPLEQNVDRRKDGGRRRGRVATQTHSAKTAKTMKSLCRVSSVARSAEKMRKRGPSRRQKSMKLGSPLRGELCRLRRWQRGISRWERGAAHVLIQMLTNLRYYIKVLHNNLIMAISTKLHYSGEVLL